MTLSLTHHRSISWSSARRQASSPWLPLLLWLVVASIPPTAHAQTAAERADAEAHALFSAGVHAFDEGRFDEAHERFQRAYELSGRPQLLYNVGAAADRGGHEREALDAYVAFLAGVPDAGNRAFVEARIAVLRSELEGEAGATGPEPDARIEPPADAVDPSPSPTPPDLVSMGPDPAPAITLFSLAGAAGVGAIVTGALSLSLRGQLEADCPMHVCADPALQARGEQMTGLAIATDVLAATSLALAIGGTLAIVLQPSGDHASVAVGPGRLRVSF